MPVIAPPRRSMTSMPPTSAPITMMLPASAKVSASG